MLSVLELHYALIRRFLNFFASLVATIMRYLVAIHQTFKNYDFTRTLKDELNERKLNIFQAFRSQGLQQYNNLISGDGKFVPDKFPVRINKNTPEFKKRLKGDYPTNNFVHEIRLLAARIRDFQLKIKKLTNFC